MLTPSNLYYMKGMKDAQRASKGDCPSPSGKPFCVSSYEPWQRLYNEGWNSVMENSRLSY